MNYIIVDLEATCFEKDRTKQKEIIEIGAVKLNEKVEIVDTFQSFIRPRVNPNLSLFCKNLTSITQNDVDNAQDFPDVLVKFLVWSGLDFVGDDNTYVCSWGFYDKNQFILDCNSFGMPTNWLKNHISIKHQFMESRKLSKCGMAKALNILKLPLLGTHHRGLDDAKNIANIFIKIFPELKFKQIVI